MFQAYTNPRSRDRFTGGQLEDDSSGAVTLGWLPAASRVQVSGTEPCGSQVSVCRTQTREQLSGTRLSNVSPHPPRENYSWVQSTEQSIQMGASTDGIDSIVLCTDGRRGRDGAKGLLGGIRYDDHFGPGRLDARADGAMQTTTNSVYRWVFAGHGCSHCVRK